MMILSLLKFEWQFHSRQWVFYIALFACISFGVILMASQSVDSDILITGPYHLARMISTLAFLILPFLVCAFAGNAIVRDHNANITELIFSTKISKRHYILSRWLGLVFISTLLFFTAGVGLFIGILLIDDLQFSIIETISAILWPLLILGIPGIILLASLLFAVGLFSRKNITIYITAIIFFFVYQILLVNTGSVLMANPASVSPSLQFIFSLIDPFGSAAFFEQVKLWSPADKNSQFFQLSGMLLANRLIVLAIALVIFIRCYQRFSFKIEQSVKKPRSDNNNTERTNSFEAMPHYKPVEPQSGLLNSWQAFLSQWRFEYLATVKTRSFLSVLLFWLIILVSEIISVFSPGGSLTPTQNAGTMEALWRFQYDMLPRFMSFFVLFFTAEIAWREQVYNAESFIHASPVGNSSLFFAKWLALLFIPFTLITVTIITCASLQLIYGGIIEWPVYLSLYYYCGLPMVCVATLCLFIHNISYNKVIGMAISLLVVIFAISPAGDYIGLEHPMFSFSSHPTLLYSDLIGFSSTTDAFSGLMRFWLSLSMVMLLLGYGLYRRGAMVSLSKRIGFISMQWRQFGIGSFVIVTLLSSYFGYQSYVQINDVAHYQSSENAMDWRVGYEKKYQQYQSLLSPKVSAISTKMALYPAERRFEMQAQYTLHNTHQEVLNEILVSTSTRINYSKVNIKGASLKTYDAKYGQYLFQLDKPMLPGASLSMTFTANHQQNGYLGLVADNLIVPGFSYVRAIRYMPFFGFNRNYTLQAPSRRKQLGLAEIPTQLTLEQAIAKHQGDFSKEYDWVNFETIISTSGDEVAISHGELVAQWQENGRNFYHYKTKGNAEENTDGDKIRNVIGYLSGRYQVASKFVDGVNLEVYYHKNHPENVEHTLGAMSDTMQYANEHFGRYPAKDLRLLEVPRILGLTGYALPQVMLISEHGGFRDQLGDEYNDGMNTQPNEYSSFDQVYRRTAHEVAHQWWGHGLNGADQEGGSILVETLAKYTELMLLEQKYGKEYVRRLLKHEHQRYFDGRARSTENERPLYRADANHLIYSKGAIAMYALKETLGEQVINSALRQLVDNYSYPKPPATTLDLISVLKAFAQAQHAPLVDRWFKQVVINDLSIVSASYQQLINGWYQVDVCLKSTAKNLSVLAEPLVKREKNSHWLGMLSTHPDKLITKGSDSSVIKLEKVSIDNNSGIENYCLSWNIKEQPNYVTIDPFYQVLDPDRNNNVVVPINSITH